jgi:hypothetical protein
MYRSWDAASISVIFAVPTRLSAFVRHAAWNRIVGAHMGEVCTFAVFLIKEGGAPRHAAYQQRPFACRCLE